MGRGTSICISECKITASRDSRPRMNMSRYENIDDAALWALILDIQVKLETDFRQAAKVRKLSLLGDMVSPLRRMHWLAGYLGITDLADLAAGGSTFVHQLQEKRFGWSVELGAAIKSLLKRSRAFCNAMPEEPSAGVFIDIDEAVLQGPELKRPVPVEDLLALFRRRQINVKLVSSCQQISIGQDPAFSHAITVPGYAKDRHRENRNLTLIYLDLDDQEKDAENLVKLCESAWVESEILLHGPLAIPWKNYKSYKGKRPYFLLLDTVETADIWLKNRKMKGRTIKELKKAEKSLSDSATVIGSAASPQITQTKVIIREIQAPQSRQSQTARSIEAESVRAVGMISEENWKTRRKLRAHKDEYIKIRVGTKLMLIVSIILIVSLGITSVMGVLIFKDNLTTRLEMSSTTMSSVVAKQAENELFKLINSANLLFQVGSAAGSRSLVDDFFANDPNLIYVGVPGSEYQYASRTWFRENHIFDEQVVLNGILDARDDELEKARNGETVIVNVSHLIPNLESPVLAVAVPYLLGNRQDSLVILSDVGDTLVESVRLQQGDATTLIVNPAGEVLADPDLTRVFEGANIAGSIAYEKMYTEGLNFGIIEFTEEVDGTSEDFIGYYKLIDNFNLGVITTVLRTDAFRDIRTMMELNIYFGMAILFLSILGIYFFAKTLTIPIQDLWVATRRIKSRNWDGAIVKPRNRDEVGALSINFNKMIPDLRATVELMEKTRVFVNDDVAEMIYEGNLPDYAETKDVTVFFSDVRGFTHMSEAMSDPQIVLGNLSTYFDAMVPCVKQTHGTVDKFIGDALMAVWGSMGEPLENHAESAINAALMMRLAIIEFNRDRNPDDPFKPPFQIGCGLHSGEATVGLMGSSSKQEWAHMGPTVNLASRIEGVNALEGTDILISPETASRVDGIFHLVRTSKYAFKGVGEDIPLYAVLGRMDDPERPRSIEDLRLMLGRPLKLEKKKGGTGAKYKIATE